LNGSLTKPGVPPTRIPLDRILELVEQGIDPAWFPAECRGWCIKKECSFYPYGLRRCRKIRAEMHQRQR